MHKYQLEIIKKLAFEPSLRFNDLLIAGLSSEHMNYYLKKLVDENYITKLDSKYTLSDKGKDYANGLNDSVTEVERQPKTSVLIKAMRRRNNGDFEYLLSKRLKQPYFGQVGRPGGKVRFGESLVEAAARELYEETGLKAETFKLEQIYHKRRHRENGEYVQDVIFYIFVAIGISGELIERLPEQENFWLTKDELRARADLITYADLDLSETLDIQPLKFVESDKLAEDY